MNTVEPLAGKIGERQYVLGGREPARLESVRAQPALKNFEVRKALGEGRIFCSVEEATRALAPDARVRRKGEQVAKQRRTLASLVSPRAVDQSLARTRPLSSSAFRRRETFS